MSRTRRSLLVALATTLGAGCTAPAGRSGDGADETATTATSPPAERTPTATASPTRTDTSTATPTPGSDVTLADVRVTPTLVQLYTDSIGVYGDAGEQFVVATASAEEPPAPPVDDFAVETDGESFGVVDGLGSGHPFYEAYNAGGGEARRWLAFALPKPLDVGRAVVTWPGGERALSDAALARLARPPTSFEVREFTAPEAVALDEPAPLSVTVANVGDADGTWVGALNRSGPSIAYTPETVARLAVPAGGTRTWEYVNEPGDRLDGNPAGEMTFRLAFRDGDRSRTVEVSGDE
jgi:hypothetical protein